MSNKEKMLRYIERTNLGNTHRYQMVLSEIQALYCIIRTGKIFEALELAFDYGMAKGYRMAKNQKEQKHEQGN